MRATKRTRSLVSIRRLASQEYDSTTLEATRVFSRSKTARVRSGARTWRRPRSLREGPPFVEAGLGLHVGAVELHVAEGPLGLGAALLQPGGEVGLGPPDRQVADGLLRRRQTLDRPVQLAPDLAPAGERPVGHHDGLA